MHNILDIKEIPNGWTIAKFDDLLDYIQPTKYIVESTEYDDKYKTPVLTAGKSFIIGYTNENSGIFNSLPVIIFDDFTTSTKFVNFPFKVKSSAMKILSPRNPLVNIKFAFYYMQTLHINIDTHKRYWISEYSKIKVPLPPHPEQQSIVSKIEELLSDLENGKQQLQTAQQQLKIYRQSLLKWAFEGKLTNKNVKDGELPKGWNREKLGELIDKPQYGTSKKCDYGINGIGVLRIPNIANGLVDSTDLKFALFDNTEIENYKLKEGDILTIRSNGSVDLVGKCALIKKKEEKYLFAGYLIKLRPKQNFILPTYLLNVLSSSLLRNQIERKAKSTSGVNNINSEELKSLIIPICPLDIQQLIVDELESKLTVCDKIEETLNHGLQQAETLRQSILKKAFEGKLAPQDPNNELASKLLERIEKEGEAYIRGQKDIKRILRTNKTINMAEELKTIIHLLQDSKKPINSKTLWQSSLHKDDIDAFYAQLKELFEKGEIEEIERQGKESFIKLAEEK